MKNITKTIQFIQTKEFAFLALVFSLVPQILHSYTSFYSLAVDTKSIISQIGVITGAIFFSIGLSGAILILTLAGWTRMAVGALVVEFFVNLVYYQIWSEEPVVMHVLRTIYSLIMPLAIALYSHVMEFFIKEENKLVEKTDKDIKEVESNIQDLMQTVINQIPREENITDNVKSYIENTKFVLTTEKGNQGIVDLKQEIDIEDVRNTRDTQESEGSKSVPDGLEQDAV